MDQVLEIIWRAVGPLVTPMFLLLSIAVLIFTEAIKRTLTKALEIRKQVRIERERFKVEWAKEKETAYVPMTTHKIEDILNSGVIDVVCTWVPVIMSILAAIFIKDLFPEHSFGVRVVYGIVAGGLCSILLYRFIVKGIGRLTDMIGEKKE